MASSYLVVNVVGAKDIPSSSNATSATTSYCVELLFNGMSARTFMKQEQNPKWNYTTSFPMRDQHFDGDHNPSRGLHLEAALYSMEETNSSELLVGKAVVDQKYFSSHSSKAEFFHHDLVVESSSSDHPEELTSVGPVVNGKLTLKVFHSATDHKALFEIEDDNRDRRTEDGAVGNNVNEMYRFLFSVKDDHRDGKADKPGSSVVVGNTNNFALRPGDQILRAINPSFDSGRLEVVERMQFLFVLVIKARDLPDVDAYGSLDPFVEVSFGAYKKGFTKCLKNDNSPEWNQTFAFSLQNGKAPPSSGVDVVVKDGDLVRDELVGKLHFYLQDIPERHPDDAQPEPTWHPLLDQGGKAILGKASLLLAIWKGSQADEAYQHAWESPYGPKGYENPRLWCLRVTIVEVQGVVACDEDEDEDEASGSAIARARARARSRSLRDELFCKACLGDQVRNTRLALKTKQTTSSGSYEWMEDLVFVAAQPFFESNLQVSVVAASNFGRQDQEEEVIGQLSIPLVLIGKRDASAYDREHLATLTPQWFDLKNPPHRRLDGSVVEGGVGGSGVSHMRIRLRTVLDGGYHIGHDPQGYMDDTRPAERQLWQPPIGRVHLGILRVTGLQNMARHDTSRGGWTSAAELKPYCVAKYGDKWVRTRTVSDSSDPVFNEQYTWDVYDITTVINVGVFDHCSLKASSANHRIGKVRIHLSCLESGRIYAHAYPLLTVSPSGVIKTGELHLAVKISSISTMNLLRVYARPTLPRMHYAQPLEEEQGDFFSTRGGTLWSDAANILALRLDRMEPPLSREVVAYLCNTDKSDSWSLRRSKANFFRLMAVFSPLVVALRWFNGVISWRNPLVTLLIHAILILALWFHELVLPLVLVCTALVGVWNYRFRPRSPPYVSTHLSYLDDVHPDELDEEFDNGGPSERGSDVVRMRYDRLRSVAGRFQTVVGDVATQFEMIQSLISWRDPRVTAIFMLFFPVAAAGLYFVPYKILVALAGFYIMRHPRLRRTNTPSILWNFFRRLPSKQDELLM